MNSNDQEIDDYYLSSVPAPDGSGAPGMPAGDERAATAGEEPASLGTGLVSLAFLIAAIRRNARVWSVAAVAGLLIGVGLFVKFPPAYQASTSVLLRVGPYENFNFAPEDNQAIAHSRAVAELAVRKLGLGESAEAFLAGYSVAIISPDILLITVSAPSVSSAVRGANAAAAAFLRFRANQLRTEQTLAGSQSTIRDGLYTRLAMNGSIVLDAASPTGRSRLLPLLIYAASGLLLGFALGLGIVVLRAVLSDRLYRRDEVAHALGAPVKLSIGSVRRHLWRPGGRALAATPRTDVQRIAAHLRTCVPATSEGLACLAVIPVDDQQVAALSVASLTASCARRGMRVVLADLCEGARAARLVGDGEPGVRAVSTGDGHVVVAVPDRDDATPIGPLDPARPHAGFTEAVAEACSSADLLLTLVSLDPALGGEHVATWATVAVAVVTAGRSSATRVHAVGEMVRMAGTSLVSAVLVGADNNDESLGTAPAGETGRCDEALNSPSTARKSQPQAWYASQ